MARISRRSVEGRYWITMSGHVSGRDLGRLERLCGPALEHETVPLTLRLTEASTVDPAAQAYLDRLVRRGALLLFSS
jgi:hypothetical protein